MFKCLYNLELLIMASAKTPFQSYDEPIRPDTAANYVYQLKDTDVDALMICPTAWKLPLWKSKVYPFWENETKEMKPPYFFKELKYYEKVFWRMKEHMDTGADPFKEAIRAAREIGISPFVSYRMNDHHNIDNPNAITHPSFWKNNSHLWISDEERFLNYLHPEVRDFYFNILEELVANYDVAGLELDFMRSPTFFPKNRIVEGRAVMTEFVRRVRAMLDKQGEIKGRRLHLSVRVPYTLEWSERIGLDIERWDAEGIIDMVTLSSFFINSPELDFDNYKNIVKNAAKYGEMHVVVKQGKLKSGFSNNIVRRTTKEMYRALSATFLDRGLDGVAFFNVEYTYHHFFNESRRAGIKDGAPPHKALRGISDLEYLRSKNKHYFVSPPFSSLPQTNELELSLYVADVDIGKNFKHALMRIETRDICRNISFDASINGVAIEEAIWTGELFPPISYEGLPDADSVRYFRVPTDILKHGENLIRITNVSEVRAYKEAVFEVVELALYKNNTLIDEE